MDMTEATIANKYSRDVYNGLPHFHDAKERLEKKVDTIPILGDVITDYQLHEDLGVSLLHRHFPLYEGEQIAKRFEPQKNTAYMYPTSIDQRRQAYSYRVVDERGEVRYEPLEFFSRSEATEEVPTLTEVIEGNEGFLEEFADVAAELGVADTFGLTVLHLYIQDFDRSEEMPLEVTDEENRILRVTIEPREELDPDETTETLWVFTPEEDMSAESVGDFGERFGPAHECSHSCTHTCNHTCGHSCTHSQSIPDFSDIPSDIPRLSEDVPEPPGIAEEQ